jgi:hypothetical protein
MHRDNFTLHFCPPSVTFLIPCLARAFCIAFCLLFSSRRRVYAVIINIVCHITHIIKPYNNGFVFLKNVLLKNNSPFEEYNLYTHECLDVITVCVPWSFCKMRYKSVLKWISDYISGSCSFLGHTLFI